MLRQPVRPETRASLARAHATAQEREGQTGSDIQSWQAVLAVHPTDAQAVLALDALLSTEGRSEERIQLLEHQLPRVTDTSARGVLRLRLARASEAEGRRE